MIALWMLSAIVFTAFLAVAAWSAERALRAASKPARGVWLFALAAGTLWPVMVPFLRRLRPSPVTATVGVTMLDAVRVVSDRMSSGGNWLPLVDRALLMAWVVVSLLLLLRYLMVWRAVRALRHASEHAVVDGVPVLVSRDIGPAVVGVRDAAVLVPRAVLELDAPLRALVLRHEEEHRRARDTWLLLALAVAVAAMPWNLPLWWIAHRARLALEVDCDARVLAAGGNATRYVQVLLLAAQRTGAAPLTPMLVASRTHLERRIVAMQDRIAQETQGRRRMVRIAGASAACVVALVVACSSPIADQTAAPNAEDVTASAKPPSGDARAAHRGMVAYDASKGGVEAMTRALALDLAPYGIRVNALAPGTIDVFGLDEEAARNRGEVVPLGRMGTPEDMAGPAVFLASDDARYVTGVAISVDGGLIAQQRSPQVDIFPLSRYPRVEEM